MIGLEVNLVEDHHDRLVGLDRLAEELLDGRVVVLLLCEHCQKNVGRLANGPRPAPIDLGVGIHVGRIQQQQPRRDIAAGPPEKEVLGILPQWIVRAGPGAELEVGEESLEEVRVGGIRRHQADRVLGAGGQGAHGAGDLAGQVVEQQRLADVGPAHDAHNQQRLALELRQEFRPQQFQPLPPGGRWGPDGFGHGLQGGQGLVQLADFGGPSLEGGRMKDEG